MNLQDYMSLISTDDDGRFKELVIPASDTKPEMDLRGRKLSELSTDDMIYVKQYIGSLFDCFQK